VAVKMGMVREGAAWLAEGGGAEVVDSSRAGSAGHVLDMRLLEPVMLDLLHLALELADLKENERSEVTTELIEVDRIVTRRIAIATRRIAIATRRIAIVTRRIVIATRRTMACDVNGRGSACSTPTRLLINSLKDRSHVGVGQ